MSRSIHSSMHMVGHVLPHELIFEILLRLPVKPLLRFKCVCKSWNSQISDPQFAKLHLHRSSAKTTDFAHLRLLFSFNTDDSDTRYASSCSVSSLIQNPSLNLATPQNSRYPLKNDTNVFDGVFGSCNGLISILSFIRIWNPATRSISQKSPPLHLQDWWEYRSSHFGFGYDDLTHTYKVVRIYGCVSTQIYSFSDNTWRTIQPLSSFIDTRPGPQDGVYLSGTLNWLAFVNVSVRSRHIVSLELGKETYTHLSLPYPLDQVLDFVVPVLVVLRDRLCVSHDDQGIHFIVWQMNEFGVEKSWTQLVKVSYEYLHTSGYPEFHLGLIVVCMSENDDILMRSIYDEAQAILYNRRDNRLQHIKFPNISLDMEYMYGTDANPNGRVKIYLESLISPC